MIKYLLHRILVVLLKKKITTENVKFLNNPWWPQNASITLPPNTLFEDRRDTDLKF